MVGYYNGNVMRERSYDSGTVHNIQHSGNILRCNKRVHGRRRISRPVASTGVRKVTFYAWHIHTTSRTQLFDSACSNHSLEEEYRRKKEEYCEFLILKGPHYMSRISILLYYQHNGHMSQMVQ